MKGISTNYLQNYKSLKKISSRQLIPNSKAIIYYLIVNISKHNHFFIHINYLNFNNDIGITLSYTKRFFDLHIFFLTY